MVKFENDSCLIDTEYNIITYDEAFVCCVGEDAVDSVLKSVDERDLDKFKNAVTECLEGDVEYLCYRIKSHTGRSIWVVAQFESGGVDDTKCVMIHFNDIDMLKENNKDNFLDILDKTAIQDYAKSLIEQNKRFYLCIIDLDNFKNINDTYGHLYGDEVLISVSRALKEYTENTGVVGRFGGDEMMVILDKVTSYGELRVVMKNIRQGIEALYAESESNVKLTVSIGVSLFPDNSTKYDDLFKIADNMLYRAKAKGKNRYIIYEPAIHGDVLKAVEAKHEHMNASSMSKDELILKMLDLFVEKKTMSMKIALQVVCDVFELDEAALFLKGNLTDAGTNFWAVYDMPYVNALFPGEEEFSWRFDSNGLAVVNHVADLVEKSPKAYDYLSTQGIESIVVYRFMFNGNMCYITFAKRSKASRKWEDKDVSYLTLIGRMFELEQVNR